MFVFKMSLLFVQQPEVAAVQLHVWYFVGAQFAVIIISASCSYAKNSAFYFFFQKFSFSPK